MVYPLASAFRLASDAGFTGIELVLSPEALWRGPEACQALAARYGLTIHSLHAPILPLPGWRRARVVIPRMVEFAVRISPTPLVVLHPPAVRDLDQEPGGQRYLEALAAWREMSRETPVQIAVETPGLFCEESREFALYSVEALGQFARREGLLVTIDTAHVGSMPYDLLHAYALVKDRLANVHLSDLRVPPRYLDFSALHSIIEHHQIPGDGTLPLEQFVRTLAEDGYQGLLTLELSPTAVAIWSGRRARQNLQRARAFVERIVGEVAGERSAGKEVVVGPGEAGRAG